MHHFCDFARSGSNEQNHRLGVCLLLYLNVLLCRCKWSLYFDSLFQSFKDTKLFFDLMPVLPVEFLLEHSIDIGYYYRQIAAGPMFYRAPGGLAATRLLCTVLSMAQIQPFSRRYRSTNGDYSLNNTHYPPTNQ